MAHRTRHPVNGMNIDRETFQPMATLAGKNDGGVLSSAGKTQHQQHPGGAQYKQIKVRKDKQEVTFRFTIFICCFCGKKAES